MIGLIRIKKQHKMEQKEKPKQFVECKCINSLQAENCIRNCGHGEEPKQEKFEEAVKPLMKWLCENTHPHTKAIVTGNLAELVEGVENVHTNEFIVD